MALIHPADPTVLTHGNGEREAVLHFHFSGALSIAITETGNAYTIHGDDGCWRAMFFGVVPDRVDRGNAKEVVQWYVAKKTYEKIRRNHE